MFCLMRAETMSLIMRLTIWNKGQCALHAKCSLLLCKPRNRDII